MGCRVLTADEEERAYVMAINGQPYAKIAETLAFTDKMAFHRYCKKHPQFARELQDARIAGAIHVEDELRAIGDSDLDPKMARVKLECLRSILTFMDPAKYGPRMDLNINQTIDIAGAIERARQRVEIDISPQKPTRIEDLE